MTRRLIDLENMVAVIEPTGDGQGIYITFLEDGDDGATAFHVNCPVEALEKFTYAVEAAIIELKQKGS